MSAESSKKASHYIPENYHVITPYLITKSAAEAIEFYKKGFGATEITRISDPSGKVGHADLKIGNSHFMLSDECPEMNAKSPLEYGGSPISMVLYVEDCDYVFNKAIAAGAKMIRPVEDQFYGDRSGIVQDPFGFQWVVSTHKEDVSDEEIQKRAAKIYQK